MKSILRFALASLLTFTLSPSTALAHTDLPHSAGPVKKIQKDWGIAADAKRVTRTINITMVDTMRFSPDHITIKLGDVVRFRINNSGQMLHELVLGTQAELNDHAAMMLKHPDMTHSEPYMVHVKPAATGEIVWRFNRLGEFGFACLIAGHFQAGMVGKISVLA
jgi:uncharacterized cupredoxin-like copper-binding protein